MLLAILVCLVMYVIDTNGFETWRLKRDPASVKACLCKALDSTQASPPIDCAPVVKKGAAHLCREPQDYHLFRAYILNLNFKFFHISSISHIPQLHQLHSSCHGKVTGIIVISCGH